jgi:hypothetical protein
VKYITLVFLAIAPKTVINDSSAQRIKMRKPFGNARLFSVGFEDVIESLFFFPAPIPPPTHHN